MISKQSSRFSLEAFLMLGLVIVMGWSAVRAWQPTGFHSGLLVPVVDVQPSAEAHESSTPLNFDVISYQALAIMPDGDVVIVGHERHFMGWIARFDVDGQIDRAFGANGRQIAIDISGFNDVAVQPDGKIVAVGDANSNVSLRSRMAVVRYLPNGQLDTSFGRDGQSFIDIAGMDDHASVVLIQPDGRILVAGLARVCGAQYCTGTDFAVARLNADGSADETFGTAGIVSFDLGNDSEVVDHLELMADGRIVASGRTNYSNCGARECYTTLFRLLPDGRFDESFSAAGHLITEEVAMGSFGKQTHVVQPDGTIVFAAIDGWGLQEWLKLMGLEANGEQAVLGYGFYGSATASFTPAERPIHGSHLVALADGSMLLVSDANTEQDLMVAKFDVDGQLHPPFGNGLGYVEMDFGQREIVKDAAVDDSGRIVILHTADGQGWLTQLNADGQPYQNDK